MICFIFILRICCWYTASKLFLRCVYSPFHRQYWFCQLHFLTEKQFLFFSSSFPSSPYLWMSFRPAPHKLFLFKIRPLGRFFTGTFHRENEQVLLKVSSDVEGIGIYVGCYHQVLWSFYSLPCQFCPDMNINCVKKQTRLKISIFWDWKACHMAPCIHQLYHTPCMYLLLENCIYYLLLLCLCLTCFWKPWNICQQCSLKPVFFITVFRMGFLPTSCQIYILM